MYDFRKLKFNPVWVAIGTVWVPHLMTRLPLPVTPKSLLITATVFVQIYFVYLGVERIIDEKAEREYAMQRKAKKKK